MDFPLVCEMEQSVRLSPSSVDMTPSPGGQHQNRVQFVGNTVFAENWRITWWCWEKLK